MKNIYVIVALTCASSLYAADDTITKSTGLTHEDFLSMAAQLQAREGGAGTGSDSTALTVGSTSPEKVKAALQAKVKTLADMPKKTFEERLTRSEYANNLQREITRTVNPHEVLRGDKEISDMKKYVNKFIR